MASTRAVTYASAVDKRFAMYLSVSIVVHLYLFFCLYSHNSVNFVIGISSMRLNEGIIQILSQMVAKSL